MKKEIIIRLKETVMDSILETLPKVDRSKILDIIGENHPEIDEITDIMNEMLCESEDRGFEAGFQTAVNLMQGNLDFEIELSK